MFIDTVVFETEKPLLWRHLPYGSRDVLLVRTAYQKCTHLVLIADKRYAIQRGDSFEYAPELFLTVGEGIRVLEYYETGEEVAFSYFQQKPVIPRAVAIDMCRLKSNKTSIEKVCDTLKQTTIFPPLLQFLSRITGVECGKTGVHIDICGAAGYLVTPLIRKRSIHLTRGWTHLSITEAYAHFDVFLVQWLKQFNLDGLHDLNPKDSKLASNLLKTRTVRGNSVLDVARAPACIQACFRAPEAFTYHMRFQLAEVIRGFQQFTNCSLDELVGIASSELERHGATKQRIKEFVQCTKVDKTKHDTRKCVTRGNATGLKCLFGSGESAVKACMSALNVDTVEYEAATPSILWFNA